MSRNFLNYYVFDTLQGALYTSCFILPQSYKIYGVYYGEKMSYKEVK